MSGSDSSESLYDAFDRILEARFQGKHVDPETLKRLDPSEALRVRLTSEILDEVLPDGSTSPLPEIAGYRILEEIGRGGMGTVYLAEQEGLARRVALKVLAPSLALSRRSRKRFWAEAKALARLRDDHVVAVHDVFEEDGILAYAMDWIEGRSLRQILKRMREQGLSPQKLSLRELAGILGVEECVLGVKTPLQFWLQVGISIAGALQKVHEAGIVHRDVKPGNILIRRDGKALLADFGLARSEDSSLSLSGGFVGTPLYAAPEQLRAEADEGGAEGKKSRGGANVDHRADLFALGVTLFEVLTGSLPYRRAKSSHPELRNGRTGLRRLRAVASHLPRDLEVVLEKAMDPDPSLRYQSASDFGEDLERVLHLEPIKARRPSLARRAGRVLRRNRPLVVAGSLGAILVLGVFQLKRFQEEGRKARLQRSTALRHQAHLKLLLPEVRKATWLDLVRKKISPAQFARAQEQRRKALTLYAQAMSYQKTKTLEVERQALDLVFHLPEFSRKKATPKKLMARYPALGNLHPIVVNSLVRASLFPSRFPSKKTLGKLPRFMPMRLNLTPEKPRDLGEALNLDPLSLKHARVWGLLGFLGGAWEVCEDSWRVLDHRGWELPFLDVALAQIYKEDGRLALALQRLQRAISLFPGLEDLQLDLAEIAIELSDDQKALQVLHKMGPKVQKERRWQVLRARALALVDPARARSLLLALQKHSPQDAMVLFALARIEYSLGKDAAAVSYLKPLVRRFPHNTKFRLALTRAALRMGDIPLYLAQVRYVVQVRFGLFRSTGEKRDLLDILQLGGLRHLYQKGVQLRSQFGSLDITGVSEAFWKGPSGKSQKEQVEKRFLHLLQTSGKK